MIGRPAALVRAALLAGAALAGSACGAGGVREAGVSGGARGKMIAAPNEAHAVTPGAPSLFELTFTMTDQDGRPRRLADFGGRPFVASMIYTRCTSVCPRLTADLKRLDQSLDARDRARTRFVLFSLDPERDTPEALRAFAASQSLDSERWTLLAAAPDDMRTLAAVLDVRFRPEADGEIAHSALIAVIDRHGSVRHRQVGMSTDPAPLVSAVHSVD